MTIYDIEVVTNDGRPQTLEVYRGKVLLIVNVASRCGFTPQYAGLETLYRKYRARDLVILGFPCDQFGHQEPGTDEQIRRFCVDTYGVTFPIFRKIEVNGARTHPLYRLLKARRKGLFGSTRIKWNFTKFLVSANGEVLRRYGSRATPARIERDLPQCG